MQLTQPQCFVPTHQAVSSKFEFWLKLVFWYFLFSIVCKISFVLLTTSQFTLADVEIMFWDVFPIQLFKCSLKMLQLKGNAVLSWIGNMWRSWTFAQRISNRQTLTRLQGCPTPWKNRLQKGRPCPAPFKLLHMTNVEKSEISPHLTCAWCRKYRLICKIYAVLL